MNQYMMFMSAFDTLRYAGKVHAHLRFQLYSEYSRTLRCQLIEHHDKHSNTSFSVKENDALDLLKLT